jgi:transposase-like protein/IS1 family transposase
MNPKRQCCHNPHCEHRGLYDNGNIGVHSQKDKRYICHRCRKTFAATTGTPLYRKQSAHDHIAQVVTLLAHGCPTQAIVAAFRLDERTVSAWQKESGEHCQRVHEAQSRPQELVQVQADEIRLKAQGMILWIAMAIAVPTRFWLGAEVSRHRDWSLIHALAEKVKAWSLCRTMLIAFDGFAAYPSAFAAAFRIAIPTGQRGRPRLVEWSSLVFGRVIKIKQKVAGRLDAIKRIVARGTEQTAQELINQSQRSTDGVLNTAFIERFNATVRSRLACCARRTRCLLHEATTLTPAIYLVGTVYNFCSWHQSLRTKLFVNERQHRWIRRTPAMAAGVTDHRWTVLELLQYQCPEPMYQKPKKRGRPKKQTKNES